MYNAKRRILNLISNEASVNKQRIDSNKKIRKAQENLKWLIDNNYVSYDNLNHNKLILTSFGEDYRLKLNKEFMRLSTLLISLPAVILTTLIIFSQFANKKTANSNIFLPESMTSLKDDSTFFIKNYFPLNDLIDDIERNSQYYYSPSSKKEFEITYSGEIIQIRANYFIYPGGCIIIKFNGEIISKIDSLRIEKTIPDGSLINEISSELDKTVSNLVNKNKEMISNKIILFLNSYH